MSLRPFPETCGGGANEALGELIAITPLPRAVLLILDTSLYITVTVPYIRILAKCVLAGPRASALDRADLLPQPGTR